MVTASSTRAYCTDVPSVEIPSFTDAPRGNENDELSDIPKELFQVRPLRVTHENWEKVGNRKVPQGDQRQFFRYFSTHHLKVLLCRNKIGCKN